LASITRVVTSNDSADIDQMKNIAALSVKEVFKVASVNQFSGNPNHISWYCFAP